MSQNRLNTISHSALLRHVESLAGLGHRISGAQNDQLARQYIVEQFKTAGLQVRTEPFDFMGYRVNRAVLRILHPLATEISAQTMLFSLWLRYLLLQLGKATCPFTHRRTISASFRKKAWRWSHDYPSKFCGGCCPSEIPEFRNSPRLQVGLERR